MDYLPIFLRLADQPVLVVGGGEVAARKIDLLVRAGAKVTVVAPELTASLAEQVARGALTHRATEFQPQHLDGVRLAIAATDRHAVNAWVAHQAERRNIPINVVDDRELSRFIMPAIVDRSPVVVAVGSSGDAPVLTRRLREKLESLLPRQLGTLAALAGRLRPLVKARIDAPGVRRRFWERFFDGPVAADVLAGRVQAEQVLAELDIEGVMRDARRADGVQSAAGKTVGGGEPSGEVVLVGAGPGDPDLLTLRGLRALQNADVILYDRLVSDQVLDLARRDAERIYVGKAAGQAHLSQEQINDLLVRLALAGKRVCRLKGGDPFIFGRGGEELEALAAHGIRFEVVPGITAAAGCAAYAGIPLTHRDFAQSLTLVTGQIKAAAAEEPTDAGASAPIANASVASAGSINADIASPANADAASAGIDWTALARPHQTVVFYMGLNRVEDIVANLTRHGAPADRAVAVIEHGTRPRQRVVTATLGDLCAQVRAERVASPALLIVGEVTRLHHALRWFNAGASGQVAQGLLVSTHPSPGRLSA